MKEIIRKLKNKIKYIYYNNIIKNYDMTEKLKVEKYIERGMKVGNNTDIFSCNIDNFFPYLIEIGDNVTISKSTILAHDASTKKILGKSKVGRVTIGNNVFIGFDSIIMPNTKIGNNVVIGARSIVTKDIPDNVVVAGNPLKVICTFEEYINKNEVNMKIRPVYSSTNKDIGNEEIERIKKELENGIGYND